MKSARERAVIWIHDSIAPGLIHDKEFVDSLTLLLKEQDKITRHACAEAILTLSNTSGYVVEHGASGVEMSAITTTSAHSAVMNTQAV